MIDTPPPAHFSPAPSDPSSNGHPKTPLVNDLSSGPPPSREQLDGKMREAMMLATNVLIARSQLLQKYLDPKRSVEDECGWPTGDLSAYDYQDLYDWDAIARRVVEALPLEACQVTPTVFESEDPDTITPFEEDWDAVGQGLRGEFSWYQDERGSPIWEYMIRAIILSRIGQFGVMVLGIDDGKELREPAQFVKVKGPVWQRENDEEPEEEDELEEPEDGVMTNLLGNVFCSTGEGGGVDPSCSGGGEASGPKPEFKTGSKVLWSKGSLETWKVVHHFKSRGKVKIKSPSGVELEVPESELRPTSVTIKGAPSGGVKARDVKRTDNSLIIHAPFVDPPDSPEENASEQGAGPPKPQRRLLYVRCFSEAQATISEYDTDKKSPRYGQPVLYNVTFGSPNTVGGAIHLTTEPVHWTRIIHVAGNLRSSETHGDPALHPVVRNIISLRKLYGGSAEMYWRGALPGIALKTHPQLGGDVQIDKTALQEMMQNYQWGLQRWIALMGMDAQSLAPQVVDPTSQINVQIEAICIVTGMPKRIFMGSERGELASSQDDAAWNDRLKQYQESYITPRVIVPLVDRLILLGVLREPEGYSVEWPDLTSQTEQEKATVAGAYTTAIAGYVGGGVSDLIPPLDFLTRILGWDEDDAQSVLDNAEKLLAEKEAEEALAAEEAMQAELDKQQEMIDRGLAPDPTEQQAPPGPGGPPQPGQPGQPPQFGGPPKGPPRPPTPPGKKPPFPPRQ